ncbi:MAG: ABC transporter ATP-binding protein, partial [Staphylococcus epidermidis]|nr:ABC transporter ATP-binding protein [Staphylococcus epidermidis]
QTKDFILTGLMNIWLDCITIIIALSIMFFLDVKLTFAAIFIFPFYNLTVYFFFGRLRKLTRVRSQALAEVQGFLHERVQGMSVIKSFAIEDNEAKNFDNHNKNFLQRAFQHTRWNAYSFAAINTVTDLGPIIVIGVGSYLAITGSITVGTLAAFVGYLEQLFGPLRRLVSSFTTLTQSFASMDRVFQLMDEDYDIKNGIGAQPIKISKGQIDLKHVSFKYNENEKEVLHDINLTINKGETVAFVGMSGGGKSTLINLIPRFYDVTQGEILIDHHNVKDFLTGSLRNQIGLVQQDNILFSDTVKENILLGRPDATDDEVVEAAKMANAHDFISNLPNGYDTEVGERGVKLSGGQKQRLSIARIFLNNPPVLILDEATSALDLESEAIIQEALDVLSKDRTTLIVAHRLSTITHADRIVVMENGRIVETGTHQQLINKRGAYEHLYSIQNL